MNEEHVSVITDREELYDKCENMEQLFDKYYLPLLDKHYSKIYELQQENQQLKIQVSAREEVANKYKEVIDEVRKYAENDMDYTLSDGNTSDYTIKKAEKELLQILDKGGNDETNNNN